MSRFNKAYRNTINYEKGYSRNKYDKGGETFYGISRYYHPAWPGWGIIDKQKLKGEPHLTLQLKILLKKFYYQEYWIKQKCDLIENQLIASLLFDISVNVGKTEAAVLLQKTLNILNQNQQSYPDIKVDGIIGDITLTALRISIKYNGDALINNVLNFYREKRIIENMEADKTQETFIGLFKRVKVIPL